MKKEKISVDALIEIVAKGGSVKTGIDIFNVNDVLLLEKDVSVNDVNILLIVKKSGVLEVPIRQDENCGVWDRSGCKIELNSVNKEESGIAPKAKINSDPEAGIKQINEEKEKISVDALIEIVANGGSVKTGIDIFNKNDVLVLEKDVPVNDVNILLILKESGVLEVPIIQDENCGVRDRSGSKIELKSLNKEKSGIASKAKTNLDLEARIEQINEEKKEASFHYKKAQTAIKTILSDIKQSGGKFDMSIVEDSVSDLINYVSQNKNASAHLINEILSHDSYLHNHSVNVCILGTAVLNRFNDRFEETKADFLSEDKDDLLKEYNYMLSNRHQMSVAFFLHDTGKVFIDESVLDKKGLLTPEEFAEAKKHSYEKGLEILRTNNLNNTFVQDIVAYHHGPLYPGEENCYPNDKLCTEIPPYVKICKLADIYDARTSKRCYKEAYNPAVVMADMFKSYVNKDKSLQLILHSFVSVVGICPPGSIVSLSNGQLAYVLDSNGPLIMPFTDIKGLAMTKSTEPIDLGGKEVSEKLTINKRVPSVLPIEIYNKLPHYLKVSIK